MHADHVESTLLSQVRVAPPNQEVDVWVLGRTRIRLRVRMCIDLLSSPRYSRHTVSFEPSSAKAVLLANDTELSVAPKTRYQQNSEKKDLNKNETPVTSPNPATKSHVCQRPSHSVLLRVSPASVFSYTLPVPPDLTSIGYVSETMLSIYRLDGLLPPDPQTSLVGDVKRLSPPTDPTDSNPPPPNLSAVAKVLNPSEATKRDDVTKIPNEDGKLKLVGIDNVPEGQIIIVGGVDGVEDWDVVRCV